MDSSSPVHNTNGPSSPEDSYSSPVHTATSSPIPASVGPTRRRRRSSSAIYKTPPHPRPSPSAAATPTSTDDAPPSSDAGDDDDPTADTAPPMFVWGTNISVQDVNAAILRFLRNFRDRPSDDEGKYMRLIHLTLEMEGESLEVDAHNVFDYDPDLYNKMVRYPLEVLAIFDIVLMDMASRINPLFEKHIQARIFNLRSSVSMRNLNPSDIEKMVSVKGMIIRCSSIIPEIREAIFRCLICGYFSDPVVVDRGRINEPTRCGRQECLATNSMTLVHNRCRFADKQIVRLQETPDEIPDGGTPHTVSLLMHDKLVDAGKPGDRAEVTGIYRAMSVRVGSTQRTVKSLFKTYIDCLHLKKTDKSRMQAEDPMEHGDMSSSQASEHDDAPLDYLEKVEQLKELSKQPDIYDRLTKSLAPNIWELDDVKKGLLCQIGNLLLKLDNDTAATYVYFWSHGMISDENFLAITNECDFDDYSDECNKTLEEANNIVGDYINDYDVILDVCYPSIVEQELRLRKSATKISIGVDVCMTYERHFYFNLPAVQRALHANRTHLPSSWSMCSGQ